ASAETGVVRHVGREINSLFPAVFVTVGLAVLFLRLADPNAWLMALMFAGFIAIPRFAHAFLGVPSQLRPFAMAYREVFTNTVAPLFYFFFATFPTRSPLERRLPWLKWAGLVIGAALSLPGLCSTYASDIAGLGMLSTQYAHLAILCFNYGLLILGFISLIWNDVSATSIEARRTPR